MSIHLPVLRFDCPRTCPRFETVDRCRFLALLSAVGVRGVVDSHTIRVAVEYRNASALAEAVQALGGEWLGVGEFELFQRETGGGRQRFSGFGFRLPGWRYPLIATDNGRSLAFDHYNGSWGNPADIDRLSVEYSAAAAVQAAAALGWNCERLPAGGVRVFHPGGGWLDVAADGSVDANGFNGVGCHAAAESLAVAIGRPVESTTKPEQYNAAQRLTVAEAFE